MSRVVLTKEEFMQQVKADIKRKEETKIKGYKEARDFMFEGKQRNSLNKMRLKRDILSIKQFKR